MNTNKLIARMNAEGLPTVSVIAKAITMVGQSMKTGGYAGADCALDCSMDDMIGRLMATERTTGGYMFPCNMINLEGKNIDPRTWRCNRDGYDVTAEADYKAYLDGKFADLKLGDVITIEMIANDTSYQKWMWMDGFWQHQSSYCSMAKSWEDNGTFLPEGIRLLTAKHLGIKAEGVDDLTGTYHAAFDAAVQYMYTGEIAA